MFLGGAKYRMEDDESSSLIFVSVLRAFASEISFLSSA